MEPSKRKALLIQNTIKQKDIAKECDVSPGCVSGVINGYYQSKRIQQAIADALKMPFRKVWGKSAGL